MPPTPTATKPPKPDPKKGAAAGKGLGKRVGPFALWVWLVMGAGAAVVAYLYLRNRGSSDGGDYLGVETVTGRATGPIENAYGGGSVGNESLASQVDPTTLETLIGEQIQPYLASAGDLRGHVYELEDAFARAGYQVQEDKTWLPPMTSGEAVLDATLGPPGGGPVRGLTPPQTRPKPPKQKQPKKPKPKPPKQQKPKPGPAKPKPPKHGKPKPQPPKAAKPKPKPKPAPKKVIRRGGGSGRTVAM